MTDPTIAGEQGRKYTRFIEGELIDLSVPSRQALADGWGDWFRARMSEHGFLTMGLDRIWAGQAYPDLAKWSQRVELLGYQAEGILRRSVTKGRSVSDEVAIASLYEDYVRITAHRPYWPGAQRTQELLKRLPKAPLAERIAKAISDEQTAYEREIDGLEQR